VYFIRSKSVWQFQQWALMTVIPPVRLTQKFSHFRHEQLFLMPASGSIKTHAGTRVQLMAFPPTMIFPTLSRLTSGLFCCQEGVSNRGSIMVPHPLSFLRFTPKASKTHSSSLSPNLCDKYVEINAKRRLRRRQCCPPPPSTILNWDSTTWNSLRLHGNTWRGRP